MNVMKSDLFPKKKRHQGLRQRSMKTSFSGYYTVSNIVPGANYLDIPNINKNKTQDNVNFLPGSLFEETVEQSTSGIQFTEAENTFKDVTKSYDLDSIQESLNKNASGGSTSLEFQKILAPFQSFRQENNSKTTNEDLSGSFNFNRNSGKKLPLLKNIDNNVLNSFLQSSENEAVKRMCGSNRIPNGVNLSSPNSSPSSMEDHHFNVLQLLAPKNQRSIESVINDEIKSGDENPSLGIFKKRDHTPKMKSVKSSISSSDSKTPKNKFGKSPKASSSSKLMSTDSSAFILAVTEGRGQARGEVGIAAMDPKRPHLVLCQISDNQRYVHSLTKMNVFDFTEVIVPNTFVDCAAPNKLYSDIRSRFPTVTLTSIQRRHFSEAIGIDLIKQYCSPESTSVSVLLRDKFYALSAAAALIKYIEFTQNVRLAPHSLRIEYQGTEDTMIIDLDTANLLELVMCITHPETNVHHSLLGVVKHCHTKGGIRLLRANILQPPCSLPKIEARLDCVTELINNPLLLCSLEAAVSSFSNAETLLNLCMFAPQQDGIKVAEYQLKYTLLLKTTLELLPSLRSALQNAVSDYFCEALENLEDARYTFILDRLQQTVIENAKTVKGSVAAHLHGCFAIKTGINSLLDVAKKTYCEIVQEISDHVTKLRETYNMSLRISFSSHKGFHIQYTLPPGQRHIKESDLPKEFILVQKSKMTFFFYTVELVALDQRSQHVLNEIKLMTNVILYELLTDIREHIGCLFNLCEYIAELDVIVSFAHVGSGSNFVRPKFGNELNLKESRHPILDVIHDGEVVPNDAYADEAKNFVILTGPNQSGKSIYIRQIALLQIMAQIGCYVPAKEACFRLTDRIFSRIAFDDSIESNACTLIVEMRDIEYIKQNMTTRSLVIIDELCRGTSIDEGTSLAFAICEELLDSSAFIFFTTHYLFLTKLEELYYNVSNYHFETNLEMTPGGKAAIRFTHLRHPGVTKAELYGLQVAELTSFPKDICANAKEVADQLSKERKVTRSVSKLLAKYQLSLQLKQELIKCEPEEDWLKMESIIENLKRKHLNLVECEGEDDDEFEHPSDDLISESTTTTKETPMLEENSREINEEKTKRKTPEMTNRGMISNTADGVINGDVEETEATTVKNVNLSLEKLHLGKESTNQRLIKMADGIKKKYKKFRFRREKMGKMSFKGEFKM